MKSAPVLSAINTRMVSIGDFVRAGSAVALTPNGRKAFFRAYEQRMDTLVTHPLFEGKSAGDFEPIFERSDLDVPTDNLQGAIGGSGVKRK